MSGNVGIFADLILLALLLIGLVLGWRQGFVQALTRIIVVVAALLLAGWIAGKLAEPAARWLEPILSEKLEQRLTAQGNTDDAGEMLAAFGFEGDTLSELVDNAVEKAQQAGETLLSAVVSTALKSAAYAVVYVVSFLLLLLLLVGAIGMLWKSLHREQRPSGVGQNTILQEVTQDNTWNTASYAVARQLTVQTLADSAATALDFRMAALPKSSTAVGKEWFNDVSFVGDSLTQGMQLYEEGMQNAMFCAYKGVGPNVIVNGTTCKRADGVAEVPLEALTAQQPRAIYVLLGTNVLGRDTDYSSFLTYYRLMLDMLSQTLPNAKIYVQSITPVRPEVCQKSGHEGLNRDRLCQINNELAAIALEKNCYFLNLWEVLADENGDLIESYAQPDGYHLRPAGYAVWTDYLCSHTEG